jgi:hypothetical protein
MQTPWRRSRLLRQVRPNGGFTHRVFSTAGAHGPESISKVCWVTARSWRLSPHEIESAEDAIRPLLGAEVARLLRSALQLDIGPS